MYSYRIIKGFFSSKSVFSKEYVIAFVVVFFLIDSMNSEQPPLILENNEPMVFSACQVKNTIFYQKCYLFVQRRQPAPPNT